MFRFIDVLLLRKPQLSSVSDKMKVMAGRKKAMEVEIAAKVDPEIVPLL